MRKKSGWTGQRVAEIGIALILICLAVAVVHQKYWDRWFPDKFSQHRNLYMAAEDDGLVKIALQGMLDEAQTFDEYKYVQMAASHGELDYTDAEIARIALEEMEKLAQSFEEWYLVWLHAPHDSATRKRALQEMLKFRGDLNSWNQVYEAQDDKSEFKEPILNKMFACAEKYDHWNVLRGFVSLEKDKDLFLKAFSGMVNNIRAFDQAQECWRLCKENGLDQFVDQILAAMARTAKEYYEWQELWKAAEEGSEYKAQALEMMLESAPKI